ncbi:MAG TPA: aminopeptidase P family protein [Mycobacteriales bacterium]|jgi:Xaa-Pro dipeptidase|nr:aminopeptidase P family protein [Mycobacteriales bacterium]
MPEIHEARRGALRAVLADTGADAALVTRLVNVRYLTGFTGSNGALLVTADEAVLATDGRYITQSERQAPDVERAIVGAPATSLAERAAKAGAHRLAYESHDVTVDLYEALSAAGPSLGKLGRAVETLRAVKDEEEIGLLREACAVADRAFARLLPSLRPGRTEKDVGRELEALMLEEGGDGPSFETIVASGPNSAVPHHRPTDRELGAGEFVKLDFGSVYRGYHSDMTRTVVLGTAADWQREVYALVAAAQAAGREALAVGAVCGEVDRVSRDVIVAGGHGDDYTHSLGHGVGLEIHEAPTLRGGATDTLADRMPVTVEPGVYLAGRGGVRIEDTLVVRAAGPELLTTTTKELLEL